MTAAPPDVNDGDRCTVVAGRHKGKSGIVEDRNISKAGHVTISVRQDDGVRFKTLAKSVTVERDSGA
jgi:ribosomal protein S4E